MGVEGRDKKAIGRAVKGCDVVKACLRVVVVDMKRKKGTTNKTAAITRHEKGTSN